MVNRINIFPIDLPVWGHDYYTYKKFEFPPEKIIFMGTPQFSVSILERVHKEYGVDLVVPWRPFWACSKGSFQGLGSLPMAVNAFLVEIVLPIVRWGSM